MSRYVPITIEDMRPLFQKSDSSGKRWEEGVQGKRKSSLISPSLQIASFEYGLVVIRGLMLRLGLEMIVSRFALLTLSENAA